MSVNEYSVLMSVYCKENHHHLRESINSMFTQTAPPSEIILVKDGPLTPALEDVINEFMDRPEFKVIQLDENVGLGNALKIGLVECKYDIVARMDSDDISAPDRCKRQLQYLNDNKNVSLVGSAVLEFIHTPDNLVAFKNVKTDFDSIKKNIKYRNPINHPTVMFRKADVIKVGNYQDWHYNEDYFLWIRMVNNNLTLENINEPLVKMRITDDTYKRRGGWTYFIEQKKLFKYMVDSNLINTSEYLFNNFFRFFIRVMIPNGMRKFVYLKLLRQSIN